MLIALVLGTVFFIEPPLEGSRPKEPSRISDLPFSQQLVPARLWQDPFEAIALYRPPGKPANDPAGKAKTQSSSTAAEPARSQCSYNFADIRPTSEKKQSFGALLVMTPASPYVEDGERRMRARYAVISALGVAGLSPRDSQHVGCHRFIFSTKDKTTGKPVEFDMPFEWFDPPDKKGRPSVLVAWLPEEQFSRAPLKKLNNVVGQLRGKLWIEVSVAVVGPQKSGTLNAMRTELQNSVKNSNPKTDFASMRDVKFYSPSATMDACSMFPEKHPQGGADKSVCKSFSDLYTDQVYDNTMGKGFIRTIMYDSEISEALVKELELRGLELDLSKRSPVKRAWLWLTEKSFQVAEKENDSKKKVTICNVFYGHRDHVVLISELDTLYGRSFPRAFIQAASDHDSHNKWDNDSDKSGDPFQWIHRFGYLRGLDGQVPAKIRGGTTSAPTRSKITSGKEGAEVQSNIRRAASMPRFDYLRRLAYRIERLDDKLRKHYCGSVKAIGILGSDVYDKLLILQALRERFPNTLFFTADMDARYLHPAEFKWTRNLIVASSHGLEPDAAFQTNIPPFRDSYQTSRFLATLFTLSNVHRTKDDIESMLVPHIYEIGRTAARHMTNINNRLENETTDTEACMQAETKHSSGRTSTSKQKRWMLADLLQKSEQNSIKNNPLDRNLAYTEVAAFESHKSHLQVHHVQATRRFDRLLEDNSPGRFILWGSGFAFTLAFLVIGIYVRNYFGLHPFDLIKENWDSPMASKPDKKIDLRLMAVTAMLWATLLLIGLSDPAYFLLLGGLIILLILIGRASRTIQERVLEFLHAKRPVKVASGLLVGSLIWALCSYLPEEGWLPFTLDGGEPFSLSDGISMWPGEATRILAGGLSIIFMVIGWMSLKTGDKDLTKNYFRSVTDADIEKSTKFARDRRIDWCSPKEDEPEYDAETNWTHYRVYRTLPERWNSVLFPATLFFLLGCISIYWLDDLHVPYRGEFMYRFDHVVVFGFMVPAFVLLLFAVIDETSLCVGWIRRLAKFEKTRTSYIRIQLLIVARRTRRVNKLIVYPFVVIFLILVSQSPYFDNWDIPVGLIVMIMLSAAYAMLCAIKLRRVSEEIRGNAVKALTERLGQYGGKNDKIELLLAEIQQLKDGAFLPWTRQPWLKAIFWLLGGLGIMSAQMISLGAMG